MPRKRMIDPDFFMDEELGECSRETRLLYICLWTIADDNGRFCPSFPRLKASCFPYDCDITSSDVSAMFEQLVNIGCVKTYEVDGKSYAWIPKFRVHQTINRPSKSKIPPCPDEISEDSLSIHEVFNEDSNSVYEYSNTANESSNSVHESSLSIHSEKKRKEEKGKEEKVSTALCDTSAQSGATAAIVAKLHQIEGWPANHKNDTIFVGKLLASYPDVDPYSLVDEFSIKALANDEIDNYRTFLAGFFKNAQRRIEENCSDDTDDPDDCEIIPIDPSVLEVVD